MSLGFRTQSLEVVSSTKMQVSHQDVGSSNKTFLGFTPRFIRLTIGFSYFIYFILSMTASVLVITDDNMTNMLFAYYTIIGTVCLHVFFIGFGILFVSFYEPYPVKPKVAYMYSDYANCVALGLCIATIYNPKIEIALVGNAILMVAQLLCFRKTYYLISKP